MLNDKDQMTDEAIVIEIVIIFRTRILIFSYCKIVNVVKCRK